MSSSSISSLMTKKQVAEFLGVTPRTVDSWERIGKLPASVRLPSGRKRWEQTSVLGLVRRS